MSGRGKKRNRKGDTNGAQQSLVSLLKAIAANNEKEVSLENDASEDEGEDEVGTPDDGMGYVETYDVYWPPKLKIGKKHPDPVVCTASLASVESAEIEYQLKLPENVIENGLLSALQLEAVVYASQAHQRNLLDTDESRAGFLIGMFDGF